MVLAGLSFDASVPVVSSGALLAGFSPLSAVLRGGMRRRPRPERLRPPRLALLGLVLSSASGIALFSACSLLDCSSLFSAGTGFFLAFVDLPSLGADSTGCSFSGLSDEGAGSTGFSFLDLDAFSGTVVASLIDAALLVLVLRGLRRLRFRLDAGFSEAAMASAGALLSVPGAVSEPLLSGMTSAAVVRGGMRRRPPRRPRDVGAPLGESGLLVAPDFSVGVSALDVCLRCWVGFWDGSLRVCSVRF